MKDILPQIPIVIAFVLICAMTLMLLNTQNSVSGFPSLLKFDYQNKTLTLFGKEYICDLTFIDQAKKALHNLWSLNKYIVPPKRQL